VTATSPTDGPELVGRTLYDISQLLEAADGAEARVRRALELLRGLVPYDQCALLEARLGHEPNVVLAPETSAEQRMLLTETLLDLFGELVEGQPTAFGPPARPKGPHLAVPLVGLDEVIGILLVQSAGELYTEEDLRALSVVASKIAAYFTTLRARAELVELARERGQAWRAAEAANRAKDEFLALVSCELKLPLTSILARAHLLRSSDDATARAQTLEGLERDVQAQAKLIDDILELASIGSAEVRLHLRIVEPAVLIRETIEGLRLEAERKSIKVDARLDGAAMPLVLDPQRIGQVLSILIANAIRFTPPSGHVEVRLERAAGYARIQVIDSGIGGDALPDVFNRPRTPAQVVGGAGVGLAIVKDLVELHGGRVRAESAGPARGATFTVELPRVPEPRAARPSPALGVPVVRVLDGIRVLLIHHDRELRESFKAVLHEHGAAIIAVASAPAALAELERARPDVLLFGDLTMSGESADSLMHEVAARARPLPVASISAWNLEEQPSEAASGFRLRLAKPLDLAELVAAVAELAGRGQPEAPRL
jgi:signal transduction histidine kinase